VPAVLLAWLIPLWIESAGGVLAPYARAWLEPAKIISGKVARWAVGSDAAPRWLTAGIGCLSAMSLLGLPFLLAVLARPGLRNRAGWVVSGIVMLVAYLMLSRVSWLIAHFSMG